MTPFAELESYEIVIAVVVVFVSILIFSCCSRSRVIQKDDTCHSSWSRPQISMTKQVEKTGWDRPAHLDISDVGVNFNKWRKPNSKWGPGEQKSMHVNLRRFDIDSKSWKRATIAIDAVLSMLLQEIKNEAKCYTGLQIDGFVRQGSAREGLKVSLADEFDALLLFHIEGLSFQVRHLTDEKNWKLPEFGHLAINDLTQSTAAQTYRELHKEQVFTVCNETGRVILNSRNLQEKVFKSIVMRASASVEKRVKTPRSYKNFDFSIAKFTINPPSINIEINLVEKNGYYNYEDHLTQCREIFGPLVLTVIDVDIVPGLEIAMDTVPDPTDWNKTMKCPRYAVLKWFTDNQPPAELYNSPPDVLWRICSSGYEKHVLDVSRGSKEECYIITALRIMKRTFRILKATENPPRQTVTVLRSYHLKQICFYCILFLVVMNKEKNHISIVKNMTLSGVREALAYFLDFLEVCLEEGKLPHFFHGNELLVHMFPGYTVEEKSLRYDLFMDKSRDALLQAKLGFRNIKSDIKRQYCANVCTHKRFSEAFREFVQEGKYYQK